ncbi:MAG: type III-B CRISPR module RAMP protein Cmr4 [Bacteroidota bacterium]
MFTIANPLFMINETPLHAGSGEGLGIVDLPIQRERHSLFPKVESSSLKGALREVFEQSTPGAKVELAFGPEEAGKHAHAGALGFSDARLLLFPVKSMRGVFAWISCKKVLETFERHMQVCDSAFSLKLPPGEPGENECWALASNTLEVDGQILLEEYSFSRKSEIDSPVMLGEHPLGQWLLQQGISHPDSFWGQKLQHDIVLLNNTDFADFVNLSCEVITRIKIDNQTGTVAKGALFTEEYLPCESLLYSLVMASRVFLPKLKLEQAPLRTDQEVMQYFQEGLPQLVQLGGNATLGKGLMQMRSPTCKKVKAS